MSRTKDMGPDRYKLQDERITKLANNIVANTLRKDKDYGSSWRKRGGVGAYMTIVRKWDRIAQATESREFLGREGLTKYDIFQRFEIDKRKEGIDDDWIDLIGYGLVLLEHMMHLGYIPDVLPEPYDEPDVEPKKSLVDQVKESSRREVGFGVETGQEHPFGYDYDPKLDDIPEAESH